MTYMARSKKNITPMVKNSPPAAACQSGPPGPRAAGSRALTTRAKGHPDLCRHIVSIDCPSAKAAEGPGAYRGRHANSRAPLATYFGRPLATLPTSRRRDEASGGVFQGGGPSPGVSRIRGVTRADRGGRARVEVALLFLLGASAELRWDRGGRRARCLEANYAVQRRPGRRKRRFTERGFW